MMFRSVNDIAKKGLADDLLSDNNRRRGLDGVWMAKEPGVAEIENVHHSFTQSVSAAKNHELFHI